MIAATMAVSTADHRTMREKFASTEKTPVGAVLQFFTRVPVKAPRVNGEQSRHATLLRRKGCHWSTKRITGVCFTYRCLLVKAITKFFALSLPKRELFPTYSLRSLGHSNRQNRRKG